MFGTKVSRKEVSQVVNATFPSYKGRKFMVQACADVTLHDLNWSGGSRSQYRVCTLEGRVLGSADRYNSISPWENPAEGKTIPLVPGAVVVRHSYFCGKDVGLTIYVHPSDIPKYLPVT